MVLFYWNGPGDLQEVSHDEKVRPEIVAPAGADAGGASRTSLWECQVDGCGKRFKKSMILARHFNTNHEEQKKDKDSWREHAKEIWE